MRGKKRIDIDAIVDEMGAVAAFARSSPSGAARAGGERDQPAMLMPLLLGATKRPAHASRTLADGDYDVAVGWDHEPVIEGQENAASIRVARANTNPPQPVEGVSETLTVRVDHGTETREFPLRAVDGQRGYYVADFIPTRAGDYRFTFVGAIAGHPVYEAFDSADGPFSSVRSAADMEFPVRALDVPSAAIAAGKTQPATQNARVLAATGLGIGVFGLVVAVATYRAHWRRRSSSANVRNVRDAVPGKAPALPRNTASGAAEAS